MYGRRTVFCLLVMVLPIALKMWGQTAKYNLDPAALDSNAKQRNAGNMASTYVPLDSWVYPAFDRLAALGYVATDFAALRPWTRMECARLVLEAEDRAAEESDAEGAALYRRLSNEFALELRREGGAANFGVQIESIYSQMVNISGQPLTDGYHFGQTIVNNFGRPYGEGMNSYSGAAIRAQAGWLALYVRGEYQQSGSIPALSPTAQSAIAQTDFTPTAAEGPPSNVSRFRLLDAYAAVVFKNNQISFGKQSLWWGPDFGGPMLYSDNAEPIPMLRYDRVSPFKLPSFLGALGPMRAQFFIGQLSGQQFVNIPIPGQSDASHVVGQSGASLNPQPYIHGMKLSVNPTPNLELSFSRTVIFAGPSFPLTWGTFWRSLASNRSVTNFQHDPGDRRAAFDFNYRIPGIRDWLTLYCDAFADDEAFPVAYPTHSAWSPGIYLPKLPYLHKLDFRAEGAVTPDRLFPGFFYFNVHYLSGYTNNRELMGNWVGRQGSGFQAWSTYWFSGRSTLQASYRQMWVDHTFLQGGRLQDFGLTTNVALGSELYLQASAQYERWKFLLLSAGRVSNVVTALQLSYSPKSSRR
jgi:Capsule assembly protein Wzi